LGWFSDAWDATTNAVSSAATAVADGVSSAVRTVEVAAQGVAKGVATAAGAVGDLAVDVAYNHTTRHAINAFRDEDLDVADLNLDARASEAVTWTEAQNDFERSVMDRTQFATELAAGALTGGAGYVALAASDDSQSGRSVEVFGQGVVKGLASGGAALGDAGVLLLYNWNPVRIAGNYVTDGGMPQYHPNWAGKAAEAVTWTEAQNDYERSLMTAGQVTGEVAGFVAVTVATGGVGGAVAGGSIAAARGTAVGARALTYGTRAAGATARFMNPLNAATRVGMAAGLGVEGGVGAWRFKEIFTTDANAAENVREILTENMFEVADDLTRDSQIVQGFNSAIRTELETIMSEFEHAQNDPERLSDEQRVQYLERVGELREAFNQLQELNGSELEETRRAEIIENLEAVTGITAETFASPIQNDPENDDVQTLVNVAQNFDEARVSGDTPSHEVEQQPQPPATALTNQSTEEQDEQTRQELQRIDNEWDRINSLSGESLVNEFNAVVQQEGLTMMSSFNMLAASILEAIGFDKAAEHFKKEVLIENLSSEFNQAVQAHEGTVAEAREELVQTGITNKTTAPAP
jgi:hypothetical protein